MMYTIFSKRNIIILSVVLLVLVLVNSLAYSNDDFKISLRYDKTKDTSKVLHRKTDESKNANNVEKVTLVVKYDIRDVRDNGYAPNDLVIKVNGLGNYRDDQMKVDIDKNIAQDKNSANKDADFTYYYNKSTNQYIFMNNKHIKDYMKGEIKLTFHVNKENIMVDYKTAIVASLTAPGDVKIGSDELLYEERR